MQRDSKDVLAATQHHVWRGAGEPVPCGLPRTTCTERRAKRRHALEPTALAERRKLTRTGGTRCACRDHASRLTFRTAQERLALSSPLQRTLATRAQGASSFAYQATVVGRLPVLRPRGRQLRFVERPVACAAVYSLRFGSPRPKVATLGGADVLRVFRVRPLPDSPSQARALGFGYRLAGIRSPLSFESLLPGPGYGGLRISLSCSNATRLAGVSWC